MIWKALKCHLSLLSNCSLQFYDTIFYNLVLTISSNSLFKTSPLFSWTWLKSSSILPVCIALYRSNQTEKSQTIRRHSCSTDHYKETAISGSEPAENICIFPDLSLSLQICWWNQSSNMQRIKTPYSLYIETDQRESGKSTLHGISLSVRVCACVEKHWKCFSLQVIIPALLASCAFFAFSRNRSSLGPLSRLKGIKPCAD